MKRARLEVDLLAAPRRARWPGYLLLAASAAASAWTLERYSEVSAAVERLDAAAELVVHPHRKARVRDVAFDEKGTQLVVRQLGPPWGALIRALERAATPDIAVLQLEPEAQQRTLRITAEARQREAVFRYMRALARVPGLTQVSLLHEETQVEDQQRALRFAVQASFGTMQ